MIRARFSSENRSQFRLLYSVRDGESIFYKNELKALSEDKLGLNVTYVYTRKVPMGWPRPVGRINATLVANTTWPAVLDPTSYICGPTSFVEAAADFLLAAAIKRDNIRTERFGPTGERR